MTDHPPMDVMLPIVKQFLAKYGLTLHDHGRSREDWWITGELDALDKFRIAEPTAYETVMQFTSFVLITSEEPPHDLH